MNGCGGLDKSLDFAQPEAAAGALLRQPAPQNPLSFTSALILIWSVIE